MDVGTVEICAYNHITPHPHCSVALQVVQVCAEHKKPSKLLKHLAQIKVGPLPAKFRYLDPLAHVWHTPILV